MNRILLRAISDQVRAARGFTATVARLHIEPFEPDETGRFADRGELRRVFERLSLEHRTVVVLHHYLGLTVDETATTIGIPVGTAKSRLHYRSRPVEVTGTFACADPQSLRTQTEETLDVGDDGTVLVRNRNGAWGQTVTMSDPRLEGSVHATYEADVYRAAGADADGPTVSAFTWRITNDGGTWETRGTAATFPDGSPIGDSSGFYAPMRVFVGSGGYEGLVAILEVTEERNEGCVADVRGIIFHDAPVPEPYIAE